MDFESTSENVLLLHWNAQKKIISQKYLKSVEKSSEWKNERKREAEDFPKMVTGAGAY